MKNFQPCFLSFVLLGTIGSINSSLAWDYEGHRIVNQLALASLPTNFPSFVRSPAATERVAFLAGEPDRWRNTPDLPLKHFNGPDHYLISRAWTPAVLIRRCCRYFAMISWRNWPWLGRRIRKISTN